MAQQKTAWFIGIVGLVFVCIVSAVLMYFKFTDKATEAQVFRQNEKTTVTPTPTPFAFQEMTIPYMRRFTFESQMKQLNELGKFSAYTSYRASYQSDGNTIYGLLTIPTGDAPSGGWPAVVFLHGYIPPTIYKLNQQYGAFVDYLARNGLVVFKPDYRGHDQSEGTAGGGYYSADYVIDTLNAMSAVASLSEVSKTGIGLWGHSMSGNVAMRVFAARPETPAVVIWAGAVYTYEDMQTFRISDNSYRPPENNTQRQTKRQQLRDAHGDYSPTSTFWRQVAVTDYLKDLKGAIQIHHAIDDDVVNIGYSRNLSKLLDATQVAHELFEYPTGGHNITGASFTTAMQRTVEFYKKQLSD